MIVIRFSTQRSFLSALIRIFENGFWASHVSAQMPDGRILSAQLKGGVLARPSNSEDICTCVRMVNLPATQEQADAFHAFLINQIGKPYDWRAIIAFALVRNWRDRVAWFCSELIVAALEHAGWFGTRGLLAVSSNHVTPRDLALLLSGRGVEFK